MKLTKNQREYVRDLYKQIDTIRRACAARKVEVPRKQELTDFIDDPDEYPHDEFGESVAYYVGSLHGMAIALDGDTDELLQAAGVA